MEIFKKTIKYLIMITCVIFAARHIPNERLDVSEIILIGLSAGSIFAIIDSYAPSYNIEVKDKEAKII